MYWTGWLKKKIHLKKQNNDVISFTKLFCFLIINYRIFKSDRKYEISSINIPNMKNNGSRITVIAGENGCGKTKILDAIASSMLEYKADLFDIKDMK